jgi:hypothetical protein
MSRPEHPIFGRASESDEADDRAFMLEGQLLRFADQIQTEMDRLDDFLPTEKFVGAQEAADWADDMLAALAPSRQAMRTLINTVSKARSNRKKVSA